MKANIRDLIDRLPPLSRARPSSTQCKICGGNSQAFDVVDFNKVGAENCYPYGFSGIPVLYYRCDACEFLFTRFFDDWSNDDFANYIYNEEYSLLDGEYQDIRPRANADLISEAFGALRRVRYLDYGGGSGAFARLIKNQGFQNIETYDPFSAPRKPEGKFDVIFAFEVIEHSLDPILSFRDIIRYLGDDGVVIFTQQIQPDDIGYIRCNWFNIGPRQGHISTFSMKTLEAVRDSCDFGYFQILPWLHAYTIQPTSDFVKKAMRGFRLIDIDLEHEIELFAPVSGGTGWYERELTGVRAFRWTCSQIVVWEDIYSINRHIRLRIPVDIEIYDGYCEQCEVFFDGQKALQFFSDKCLTVEIENSGLSLIHKIELKCPPLRTPRELTGAPDDRLLGMAIRMDPQRIIGL